ncbi:DUF2304 domain-containing protein [Cryobacterium luteum]|uniref:DUF2304 domain-containing protein n=1 Tax=Cryobacterium luteum TaxID=1424661 RepID=A0A1H8KRM7_9MICO|nr:DUF2304 domain-containing protein [Cryobacterium luteum]TFB95046.1 DUF2304 domain-containing protein [Cryobacterium luteum]SEN95048.1 hypothetical protein SAMN05216281_12046 [Cryobacterium luteum]
MNPVSYAFAIAAALIALLAVIEMLRRQRFRERHAFWWLLAAIVSLVVSIFPGTLEWTATLVGVEVPSNLAFFASIVILFFVSVQHSSELTTLEEKTRVLAEHTAMVEERLATLEAQLSGRPNRS